MIEQEQKDLDLMKIEEAKIIQTTWYLLHSLDRADEHTLAMCGYRGKTNADAMRLAYQSARWHIAKLHKAYYTKYPD